MSDSNKKGPLPEKKYLFVLLATKSCQLKFDELLVYSFLLTVPGRSILPLPSGGSPTTSPFAERRCGRV